MLDKMTVNNWWQGAVIYQIYPRSFCDSNGDGIGDLNGITSKLDYVASLGVDGIWISPFFTSPMHDFGYDISDFTGVDPIYGTLEDFDRLLATAHSLGLKVIIDQVYSHASIESDWFEQSRQDKTNDKADWFVWADAKADGSRPNNWQAVFAGPSWTWDEKRQQYYFHNFLPQQPDLNLHNPQVQEEMLTVAKFWLERGVDGFRLDATNFYMHDPELKDNPPCPNPISSKPFDMQDQLYNQSHPDIAKFLRRIRRLLNVYGDKFTVAEVGGRRSLQEMAEYTSGDNTLNTAYSFIFLEEENLSPSVFKKALGEWDAATESWPSWTFSNHDRRRVVTRWCRSQNQNDFAKLMNSLLFCLRGTIFLYQGEELGLPHADIPYERLVDPEAIENWPDTLGRDGCRTPMPWQDKTASGGWPEGTWLPIDERHYELSVDKQEKDTLSSLAITRELLALRKVNPALIRGDLTFLTSQEPILAFIRELDGVKLLCVFNLGEKTAKWPNPYDNTEILYSIGDICDAVANDIAVCSGYIARIQ